MGEDDATLTRSQIERVTRATAALVASGKVGIAPTSTKHLQRLKELRDARLNDENAPDS